MAESERLEVHAVVERKHPKLPRFVVVPSEVVEPWDLEGTTVVEVTLNGHDLGRRTLKHWGGDRDCWFIELTERHAARVGVDTGDGVALELRRADVTLPPELSGLIASDPGASAVWEAMTASQRRQLSEHVRAGRRADTRVRRAKAGLTRR